MADASEETRPIDEPRRPTLRVGIAGLGRAVFSGHLPALKALPELYSVVAVCDLLKERRDLVEKDFPNVRTYRRVEDMLDDPDIDLVDVALPSAEHVNVAMSSLQRNKWTLVETPLAVSQDDAKILQAAAVKTRGKLVAYTPGLFSPDFRLALSLVEDPRLGDVFEVHVRHQDYVRRDDWQSVKRCLGGCVWHSGTDAVLQALALMRSRPAQLWSELKRVVSLGDAEDFAHIVLKARTNISAAVELCGGRLAPYDPSFTICGTRGSFSVAPGAAEGVMHVIDPAFRFPRRRSSVRTPPLCDMHESFPVVDIPCSLLPGTDTGPAAFWRALYATIRTAAPFPVALDDVLETVRYLQIVKKASPFST